MSTKKEEGNVKSVVDLNLDSSVPPLPKPMTEAERLKQQKIMQKQAALELADYKKRIRASNEVKQLQVDEMRLGVEYYEWKVKFRALQPKMEELDALEAAEAEERKKKEREKYEAWLKEQEEKDKPKIIQPKVGKPRK